MRLYLQIFLISTFLLPSFLWSKNLERFDGQFKVAMELELDAADLQKISDYFVIDKESVKKAIDKLTFNPWDVEIYHKFLPNEVKKAFKDEISSYYLLQKSQNSKNTKEEYLEIQKKKSELIKQIKDGIDTLEIDFNKISKNHKANLLVLLGVDAKIKPGNKPDFLQNIDWYRDGDALEFRHTKPYEKASDFLNSLNKFCEKVEIQESMKDPLKAKKRARFHLNISKTQMASDFKLEEFLKLYQVQLALERANAGFTEVIDYKFTYSLNSNLFTRGVMRLKDSNYFESREHISSPREELEFFMTQLSKNYHAVMEEQKKKSLEALSGYGLKNLKNSFPLSALIPLYDSLSKEDKKYFFKKLTREGSRPMAHATLHFFTKKEHIFNPEVIIELKREAREGSKIALEGLIENQVTSPKVSLNIITDAIGNAGRPDEGYLYVAVKFLMDPENVKSLNTQSILDLEIFQKARGKYVEDMYLQNAPQMCLERLKDMYR